MNVLSKSATGFSSFAGQALDLLSRDRRQRRRRRGQRMAGFTKTQFIWMNGSMMPWDAAQVHVTAHALQYGTGVFEGMRSYDTPDGAAIFRLDAHIRRLAASASHYELELPYSFDQLCTASLEVVRVNGLDNAYLRPLAFFDSFSFAV